jgi:hypothetical protein
MSQENVEVVRSIYEAFNRRDPDAARWSARAHGAGRVRHADRAVALGDPARAQLMHPNQRRTFEFELLRQTAAARSCR